MIDWINNHLVPEARDWWRLWSVRLNAIGLLVLSWLWVDPVTILAVWNMLPVPVAKTIPQPVVYAIGAALFALSMMSRLVVQKKVHRD
jgi:hypothetical protein